RLEEQLRGQADAIEALRRERKASGARAPSADADDPALAEAREAESAAFERRRDAPLIQAQLDARSLPVRIDVLKLEIAVDELELAWIGRQLAALRVEFDQRSTSALSQLTRDLQRLVEREPDADRRFSAELARLRTLIDQAAETQSRIRGLEAERQRYMALGEDLSTRLENIRLRLEHSGPTDAVGTLFLEERRRLSTLADFDVAARQIGRELDQSRLRIIGYRELVPPAASASPSVADDEALAALRDLERRVADALLQGEGKLIEELEETDRVLRDVSGTIDELDRILNEALLWWPSHVPVSLDWAMRAPNAFFALIDPAAWRTTGAAFRQITLDRPYASVLTMLVVGLLYRAGRGTGRRLRELAEKTQHRFTDSMTHTWKAMGWSLLRVLPAPVLLGATGFRLERLPDTDRGVDVIAAVLWVSAIWWLAGHLLAIFISRNGVATVHFDANPTLVT